MRRIAALLVLLLTATPAVAKNGGYKELADAMFGVFGCCATVPVLLVLALAFYDWRKARRDRRDNPPPTRTAPPPGN